jgi:phage shock protein A
MALLARLNALLESLLTSADDPEERIRHLVADLRARQADGRRALGMAIALELKLLDDVLETEDELAADERAAKDAIAAADEPRASDFAARALTAKAKLDERRARHAEQKALAEKVRTAVLEASRRTQEVAHAKSVLLARARCAEAMQSIAQSLQLLASPEVRVVQERLQASVERKEHSSVT